MEENAIVLYRPAAEIIKTAILQGQYEAAKGVNRIQLAVYFGIGKFVPQNTRKGVWGSRALESISQILRKELPGLKGYSATQLREMRLFYEAWQILDPNSSVMTDDNNSASVLVETESDKSTLYRHYLLNSLGHKFEAVFLALLMLVSYKVANIGKNIM